MRGFRYSLLGIFFFALTWLIASCNSDSEGCIPGETRLCAGVEECRGIQTCQPNGSFGACDCTGTGIIARGGSGNQPNVVEPLIGRGCRVDTECGQGLRCVSAESNDFFDVGGVAGGYCTKDCTTDTTAQDCAAIDRQSECLEFNNSGQGLCFRTCLTHSPVAGEEKCFARSDVACNSGAALGMSAASAARETGWCLPRCNSDADCPGRVCSLANGICQAAQSPGLPIGAVCDTSNDCAGQVCLNATEDVRVCSAKCVFKGRTFQPSACGFSTKPRGAGCLLPLVANVITQEGIGDVGACLEVCEVDSDCELNATLGWVCSPNTGIEFVTEMPGYCLPPVPVVDAGAGDGGLGAGELDASTPADGG